MDHHPLRNMGFELARVTEATALGAARWVGLGTRQEVNGAASAGLSRKEVRIDARPSDCLVLALKNKVDLYVSEEVFNQVQDVSKISSEVEGNLMGMPLEDLELDWKGQGSEGDEVRERLDRAAARRDEQERQWRGRAAAARARLEAARREHEAVCKTGGFFVSGG